MKLKLKKRVVITGLGIVAPNGIGLEAFTNAIKNGISGIEFHPELERLKFSCQIAGTPKISEEIKQNYFSELELRSFNSSGILYGKMLDYPLKTTKIQIGIVEPFLV